MCPTGIPGDTLHHFATFGVFVLPIRLLRPERTWCILVIAILYDGLIEIIRPHVNRHSELGDFWADAVGALIGVLLRSIVLAQLKLKRGKP